MNRRATIVFAYLISIGLGALGWLFSDSVAYAHDYDDDEYEWYERHRLMLALDLDYSTALTDSKVDQGGGGAFRVGLERDHSLISYVSELQVDMHHLTADPEGVTISTAKVGGRIRFLRHLEPGVFGHAGAGHIAGDRAYVHTDIAVDAGLTLDLTVFPLIDIGLHTAWNRVFGNKNVSYVTVGAQLTLVL